MQDGHPAGFRRFHRKRFINYQLNRLHATGHLSGVEVKRAASAIRTIDDYVRVFDALSWRAEEEGRLAAAASACRAAEFFTPHDSPQKQHRYRRFIDLFDAAFVEARITRHDVPYGAGRLPTRHLEAVGAPTGATVVFFAGFDSIVEEFFTIWRTFAEAGFNVIAFDGPGQGGARTIHGVTSDHDWEKPIAAICDHFDTAQVALIGLSMGGYWAIRAAAYEPRVAAVVAWPPVYDWLERVPATLRRPLQPMLRWRRYMNGNIRLRTRLSPALGHIVNQAVYNAGGHEPFDAVRWFLGMNRDHISAAGVTQPVLLVGGEHDTFQPPKLLHAQQQALTRAASVTTRLFTAAEHADQHCQLGNLPRATAYINTWLRDHTEPR